MMAKNADKASIPCLVASKMNIYSKRKNIHCSFELLQATDKKERIIM
jgi:hypothetical protein